MRVQPLVQLAELVGRTYDTVGGRVGASSHGWGPLFNASTVAWLKAPLKGYTFCVLIMLLLRLERPPFDGLKALEDLYKPTYSIGERAGSLYICTKLYSVTVREEEAAIIPSFQAINWRAGM